MDGGASSPARCRGSNFQFEPRQFRPQGETAESCGFCASCHPHQFPLKSVGFPGAETARKRFLLWEMGFPGAKISCDSAARGDFDDLENRQNRSALTDLKTLWVFNLLAGVDFYARGLRPSRALPGALGRASLAFSRSLGGLGRASLALSRTPGAGSRFAYPLDCLVSPYLSGFSGFWGRFCAAKRAFLLLFDEIGSFHMTNASKWI